MSEKIIPSLIGPTELFPSIISPFGNEMLPNKKKR